MTTWLIGCAAAVKNVQPKRMVVGILCVVYTTQEVLQRMFRSGLALQEC